VKSYYFVTTTGLAESALSVLPSPLGTEHHDAHIDYVLEGAL
jgi:hypothetical protein